MRIGLTYDLQTNASDQRQAEFDPPATVQAVHEALEGLGHDVVRLGNAHELLAAPHRLDGVELVFNLAEGSHGRCREAWVPTLLELYGVPYVGSDPLALMLGLDKVVSKRLAQASGVATPSWRCVERPEALPAELPCAFPVIVKPRWEGAGRGIDAQAVVRSRVQLEARLRRLFARCPEPMLIEAFIPSGELTVFLIGNDPSAAFPVVQRPLDPATGLSCHVVKPAPEATVNPLVLEPAIERAAQEASLAMFEVIGCRDMARVDFRVDEAGRLWFLEINPLPSFDPEGSLGLLAEYLGTSYAELIGRILDASLLRIRHAACGARNERV
ncbi:MAG: D-alanine--D-alanine ligase [Candidatus Omnitrophica bacterium]|nr:D-alanine--D-alanine ligase [Candidatus Omnitrophota bacterium]MBI2495668.1 D-alanine--D-alanine ligase [Candidatus Omnitrophota bacterium]MBI3021311.1 D-alanine--D-alanine ligase [Candidatus Omnitrophota bacterium]MBI3082814.1 D-alanine--D-alanine ligase [Candidatus Omnitrophota bacterium]